MVTMDDGPFIYCVVQNQAHLPTNTLGICISSFDRLHSPLLAGGVWSTPTLVTRTGRRRGGAKESLSAAGLSDVKLDIVRDLVDALITRRKFSGWESRSHMNVPT